MKKGVLAILGLLTILFVSFFVAAHTASDLNIKVGSTVETLQKAYNAGDLMGTRSSYDSGNPLDPGHDAAQIWVSVKDYPTGATLLQALQSTNKLCPASTPQYPGSTGMPNPGHFGYDIQTSSGYSLQDAINNYQFCCFNSVSDCAPRGKNCGDYYKCGGSTTTKELSCGTTPSGQVCNNGVLCAPNCKNADGSARVCGSDGCGGSCGSCASGLTCEDRSNNAYNNVGFCCPERTLVGQACGPPDIGTACQSAYRYNVDPISQTTWAGICTPGTVCDTTSGSSTIGKCVLSCTSPKVLKTASGFANICCDNTQINVGGACCDSNTGNSCGGGQCTDAGTIACDGTCHGATNLLSGAGCTVNYGTGTCDGNGNCIPVSAPTPTTCYSAGQPGCLNDRSKSCCAGSTCQGTGQGICAPPSTTTPTSTLGCIKCANENGYCSFNGISGVIYGSGTTFYPPKTLSGGTACTNSVFGDPTPGIVKACYICSIITTHEGGGSSTTTTTPVINQGSETANLAIQTAIATAMRTAISASDYGSLTTIPASANPTSSPTAGAGVGISGVSSGSFTYGGHTYLVVTYSNGESVAYRDNLNGLSSTNTGTYFQDMNGQWGYLDTSGQLNNLNSNTGDPNFQNFYNSANEIQANNVRQMGITPFIDPAIPHGAIVGSGPGVITTPPTTDPGIPHGAIVGNGPGTGGGTGGGCFTYDTLITTPTGIMEISNLKIGDKVLSYDTNKNKFVESEIQKLLIHKENTNWYYLIKTKDSEVKVTNVHPFYFGNGKYIQAENLKVGDFIYVNVNNVVLREKILSKDKIYLSNYITVYNLELNSDGPRNYFANSYLVHNGDNYFDFITGHPVTK